MIWIGKSENQFIDVHRIYVQAVYDELSEKMADLLSDDDKEDLFLEVKYHNALHLDGLSAEQFQVAYNVLTKSKNELIDAIIDNLKPMFESDPRFQAA